MALFHSLKDLICPIFIFIIIFICASPLTGNKLLLQSVLLKNNLLSTFSIQSNIYFSMEYER